MSLQTVRHFNRVVTERIGALEEEYLDCGRPLGASRVLWELGHDGAAVRELRDRLDLDAGYLSRVLASLRAEGLVELVAEPGDRRVRRAIPTSAGRVEIDELDRRSNELAARLLDPLRDDQRTRLVDAMATVSRLLTAGLVELAPTDPDHPDARECLRRYFAELDERFDDGFELGLSPYAQPEMLRPPSGVLLVARLRGRPVGCGAVKFHDGEPHDIKRMWVDPDQRGLGLGRRLLRALESEAVRQGAQAVRLETNRNLAEAIALYRSEGYREVPAFNDEVYGDHWFRKDLARP